MAQFWKANYLTTNTHDRMKNTPNIVFCGNFISNNYRVTLNVG